MSERTAGAPLSKETVRALRERAGLSQEALAVRLGLAGKAVVSGWETGRTTCEGPAAELLLLLFAADATRTFTEINTAAEATWRRASTWPDAWRQVSAVPEAPLAIDRDAFAALFPGAEIPTKQRLHGFPFVEVPQPNVFGIGSSGWSGSLPAERDRAPHYLWQLDRSGAFLYREVLWEDGYESATNGHTHIGSLLEIAACTTVFLGRFANATNVDRSWRYALRMDLEGVQGRGIVAESGPRTKATLPKMFCTERHVSASHSCSLDEIATQPLRSAFALAREIVSLLRPDLSSEEQLAAQLESWVARDRQRDVRMLRFLDDLL